MNPRKDGGPAFPLENPRHLEDGELFRQFTGMSLRDWYAGKVLQGFCANPTVFAANEMSGWDLVNCTEPQLAEVCLRIADAMLGARARPLREPRETGEE